MRASQGGYDETSLASLSPADYRAWAAGEDRHRRLREHKCRSRFVTAPYGLTDDLLGAMASLARALTLLAEAGSASACRCGEQNAVRADIRIRPSRVLARPSRMNVLHDRVAQRSGRGVLGMVESTAAYRRSAVVPARRKVTAAVSISCQAAHARCMAAMDSHELTGHKQALLPSTDGALVLCVCTTTRSRTWEAIFARGSGLRGLADRVSFGCRFDGWDEVMDKDCGRCPSSRSTPPRDSIRSAI